MKKETDLPEEKKQEWISLEKELPQIPAMVYMEMISNPGRTFPIITTDGERVWIALHGGDPAIWRAHNHMATHFMYLPEPPKFSNYE